MKVATVLDSSLPISMVFRHRGMISVDSRKLMTSVSSIWHRHHKHCDLEGTSCCAQHEETARRA